jgi:hypothetical protein
VSAAEIVGVDVTLILRRHHVLMIRHSGASNGRNAFDLVD